MKSCNILIFFWFIFNNKRVSWLWLFVNIFISFNESFYWLWFNFDWIEALYPPSWSRPMCCVCVRAPCPCMFPPGHPICRLLRGWCTVRYLHFLWQRVKGLLNKSKNLLPHLFVKMLHWNTFLIFTYNYCSIFVGYMCLMYATAINQMKFQIKSMYMLDE